MASSTALDAGASAASTVVRMQQLVTQYCTDISDAIADDQASFNGVQCGRISDLFDTSVTHAMDVLDKVDGLAKAMELSADNAKSLDSVFQEQGLACDKAASAIFGACPKSTVENTENTQDNLDKEMQTVEGDLQENEERKRRI
ncbi:hypothetical protein N0V93_008093 [Gnomoniopsis smithogilvyi]|uniref:Uncharacterized protein n=1 Tax=Gnomoniopsis smithogilvyi TaxID=1191159 RepID=A0A9W8YL25_9PEZI|nr:hypothetical protein N0V93_008093 [Gnomoniopsis smithogilvyi]